ncbi:MAG: bifunctional phosphoserine phosphatase/homoserine phosphotransferase ThrH [archaeon]
MKIVCFDLEGVLVPEFWEEFSRATKIPELMKTTRDEPNYDKLMQMRMKVLKEHGFTFSEIMKVVNKMEPLPGAKKFMDWIKTCAQPVILTGSYYEYITPLVEKIGSPFMIANNLKISPSGEIIGYKLREKDGKVEMVKRFKEAGFEVIAVGDSFNDLEMLKGADKGIIFRGAPKLLEQEKGFPHAETYEELKKILEKIL